MQCREIVSELDAYLTGELTSDASAEVKRHLKQCTGCRTELEMLQKESTLYHDYASALDIPDGVSCGIPAANGKSKSVLHRWQWAAAAAVLVAVVLLWRFAATRQDTEMRGNIAEGQMTEVPVLVHQTVTSYEKAVSLLQASYEGEKPNLDPALVRELDRNLQVAETAIAECRLALKKNPNNPQVIEFLLLDYDKQLGILKQITEAL